MTDTQEPTLHRLIATQIRRMRTARGWSAERLAAEMRSHGGTWDRPILTNFENGRRTNISIEEIVAIARALDVPPITIIFPIGQVHELILAGEVWSCWEAAQWFAGRAPAPGGDSDRHAHTSAPITLYSTHERLIDAIRRGDGEATTRQLLARTRDTMRLVGMQLPPDDTPPDDSNV